MLERLRNPTSEVEIAVVGKYMELQDAYKSKYEALTHAGIANKCKVKVRRVHSEAIEEEGLGLLDGVSGVLVASGFGERGIEGKVLATEWARKNGVPVEYLVFEDEGHGFRRKENRIRAAHTYLDFLGKYLRGDAP